MSAEFQTRQAMPGIAVFFGSFRAPEYSQRSSVFLLTPTNLAAWAVLQAFIVVIGIPTFNLHVKRKIRELCNTKTGEL
jgi:hypothetical protein